jgi:hypothetical protein
VLTPDRRDYGDVRPYEAGIDIHLARAMDPDLYCGMSVKWPDAQDPASHASPGVPLEARMILFT